MISAGIMPAAGFLLLMTAFIHQYQSLSEVQSLQFAVDLHSNSKYVGLTISTGSSIAETAV